MSKGKTKKKIYYLLYLYKYLIFNNISGTKKRYIFFIRQTYTVWEKAKRGHTRLHQTEIKLMTKKYIFKML